MEGTIILTACYWILTGILLVSGNSRIVGGAEARPHLAPHTAHLDNYYGMFCAGSLVDAEWVLTAAHCLVSGSFVVLGDHDLSVDEGTEQIITISNKLQHPSYNDYNQQYDVMLLKLATEAVLNEYVQPIAIPTVAISGGVKCTVCGWGYTTGTSGNLPDKLQCVQVTTTTNEECNVSYNGIIQDNMICAGDFGKDACNGDSGGPMECGGYLHGVTSWGYSCALEYYPGVYGRVTSVTDWINHVITYY